MPKPSLFRHPLILLAAATGLATGMPVIAQPAAAKLKTSRSTAAQTLTVQMLADQEAIREQWGRYGMLLNGDTISAPDSTMWAHDIFTPDASFRGFGPNGEALFGADGLKGRAAIAAAFADGMGPGPQGDLVHAKAGGIKVHRLFPINTVFDAMTATTARTRTSVVVQTGQNSLAPVDAYSPALAVYHDDWVETGEGWRKAASTVYYTTLPNAEAVEDTLTRPTDIHQYPADNGQSGRAQPGRKRDPLQSLQHIASESIVFDEIAPTTARTRVDLIVQSGLHNQAYPTLVANSPSQSLLWQDVWRKEADGIWRKSHADLRETTSLGDLDSEPGYIEKKQPAAPRQTIVAPGMSLVDVLTVTGVIRERLALYSFLIDGDGLPRCGMDPWAVQMFTDDAPFTLVSTTGKIRNDPKQVAVGHVGIGTAYLGYKPYPACAAPKPPKPAGQLSGVPALVAKAQIRDRLARSVFLRAGDGVAGPDLPRWVEQTYTPDASLQSFASDGTPLFGATPLVGRDAILAHERQSETDDPRVAGRWQLVNTYYDSLTADSAQTRTVAYYTRGPKRSDSAPLPILPLQVVFHDVWRHGAAGWKIVKSEIR